jgi:antitoxin component YwqK of YwqJK toxin-antitoxin module
MRRIFILVLVLVSGHLYAQKLPDYGRYRARLTDSDKTIEAEYNPVEHLPSVKSNLFYYWYNASRVHATQGGYSGQLLNGLYTEYYLNRNLKEQGIFKKGLKDGLWKSWNQDGTLKQATNWNKGIEVAGDRASIWQRLNIFKKNQSSRDTIAAKKP